MRIIKLTKEEKAIEAEMDQYVDVSKAEFKKIAREIAARKKDTVLNIRINSMDLKNLKRKAAKLGVRYQSFVSEILHRLAQS